MENTSCQTFDRPPGWEGMPLWKRMQWLCDMGFAADLLEAMSVLKAEGEWPSDEEMGMAGGRALSPMGRGEEGRGSGRKAGNGGPPSSIARGSRRGGRRDRLSTYY